MPIVTRKEFAELCGDDEKKVNVWISRLKVLTTQESKKLINTEDPVNATFISDRQIANATKQSGESVPKPNKIVSEKPKNVRETVKSSEKVPNKKPLKDKKEVKSLVKAAKKVVKVIAPAPTPATNPEIFALSRAKMDQESVKRALEIENLELAKQQKLLFLNKAAGELLPVDLVRGVLTRHADVIMKNFEMDFVKMATVFCNIMAGGDQTMLVQVIKESKEILSKSIERAGNQANEEVAIQVSEFSKKLERGQRRT